MYGIPCIVHDMTTTATGIPDKVRGVAAEKRYSQQRIADALSISRSSVVERLAGRVPFTAEEILTLSIALNTPIFRFFPTPAELAQPMKAVA